MEPVKSPVVAVDTLTTEILILKQQTAQNLIEIGKRLIVVKESLGHGEWLPWLKEKVDFSDQQARRFMNVAKECANSTALLNLPPTKVFALLDLPADQREEFVAAPHVVPSGEVKMVDEMTTRELQQVVKQRDELQRKFDILKDKSLQIAEEKDKLYEEKLEMQVNLKDLQKTLESERKNAKSEVKQLTSQLKEAKKNGTPDTKIRELEEKLVTAEAEVQRLTEQLNEPVTLEAAVVEAIPEEVERELDELRQKNQELEAKQGKPDPLQAALSKFAAHFDVLVNDFKLVLTDLASIQGVDAAAHEKYRGAVTALISKMQDKV